MIAALDPPTVIVPPSDVEALGQACAMIDAHATTPRRCQEHHHTTGAPFTGCQLCQAERLLPVGKLWLDRACHHLNRRIDQSLRDSPRIDSEQAALALLKQNGLALQEAAKWLDHAAEALKSNGRGRDASLVKQAAGRTWQASEGLS